MSTRRGYVALGCLILLASSAAARADNEQVRRVLGLLRGIELEYQEAFDERGALVRPLELDEAALLLGEVHERAEQLGNEAPAGLSAQLATLAEQVERRVAAAEVAARVHSIRTAIEAATGVAEQTHPGEPPSAERAAPLYRENCATCHGDSGAGDGADAARLQPRPQNFTDPDFMRAETPADFFSVISLGRRRASMPAWVDVLSVQQRWDLVRYLWFMRPDFQPLPDGQRLFIAQCARCHAPVAGSDEPAESIVPLTNFAAMAERSDGDLFAVLNDAPVHRPLVVGATALSDRERWQTTAFVRDLAFRSADPSGVGNARRLDAALARIAERVADAVNSYRLREDGARSIAADAYLDFEPLEPAIAPRDAAAVVRVEEAFVQLQKNLRQPDNLREVENAAAILTRALAGVPREAHTAMHWWIGSVVAALAIAVAIWVAVASRRA